MPKFVRTTTAAALAAAVLVGAAAPAGAAGEGFAGGMQDRFLPENWEISATDPAPGGYNDQNRSTWETVAAAVTPERQPEEQTPTAPAERAQEAATQAAETAKQAAQLQNKVAHTLAEAGQDDAARLAQQGAAAGLNAAVAAADAAEALAAAAPTNLGAATAETFSVPLVAAEEDLLMLTYEEVVGDFETPNTAALAVWESLLVRGWQPIPGDGMEALYHPAHPRFSETVKPLRIPENVFQFRTLAGSDVTEHTARVMVEVLGWHPEAPGSQWLLPPEAL